MRTASFIVFLVLVNLLVLQLRLPVWACIPLVFSLGYGVYLPLLLRFGTSRPANPAVQPFDPAIHDASLEQLTHIASAAAALRPLGFQPLGELFVESETSSLGVERSMLLVLDNDAGTRAVATAIVLRMKQRTLTRNVLELTTRYPDHVRLTTNLEPSKTYGVERPDRVVQRFPQLRDFALLARAHAALLARDETSVPTPRELGSLPDVLAEYLRGELRAAADAGFLSADRSGTRYRLTFFGALRVSLRLAFPVNRIIDARARRRAAALLAELGLANLELGLAA